MTFCQRYARATVVPTSRHLRGAAVPLGAEVTSDEWGKRRLKMVAAQDLLIDYQKH
jgi:hypothetical protein